LLFVFILLFDQTLCLDKLVSSSSTRHLWSRKPGTRGAQGRYFAFSAAGDATKSGHRYPSESGNGGETSVKESIVARVVHVSGTGYLA
jgi:hypothetical protein